MAKVLVKTGKTLSVGGVAHAGPKIVTVSDSAVEKLVQRGIIEDPDKPAPVSAAQQAISDYKKDPKVKPTDAPGSADDAVKAIVG
jgi:hypothetical protein